MFAADTSSLIAYLGGSEGRDVTILESAMIAGSLYLPPAVVTELLSDAKSRSIIGPDVIAAPRLTILSGYWERAGIARAALLGKGLAAKIPDALIAQACIDHDMPLITRDSDFRHFAEHCGLRLA